MHFANTKILNNQKLLDSNIKLKARWVECTVHENIDYLIIKNILSLYDYENENARYIQ